MANLDGYLKFVSLINDFQKIKRRVLIRNEDVYENDLEHSYQLALVGWYIAITDKLSLDINKVISYSLIHDLVEVYAGDTYAYDADKTVHATKAAREKVAQQRIAEEFPEFPELHGLIEAYELKSDEESKFVYALDKVLPMTNIYLDNGRTWQQESITLKVLVGTKKEKVALSPDIEKYFNELVVSLSAKQRFLFGNDTYMP